MSVGTIPSSIVNKAIKSRKRRFLIKVNRRFHMQHPKAVQGKYNKICLAFQDVATKHYRKDGFIMRSILHDLFFGNITPWERRRSENPNHTSINQRISDIKAHFKEALPPDEYKQLEEIESLYTQSSSIEDVDIFEYGISIGALLMIEVFGFKERKLTDQNS